jgi:hypothetical protein
VVVASLTIGGVVGVVLSGAFLWWEVGRFAAPQVPETRFDERKLLAAYTVGLFVGVPLAVAFVLYVVSAANSALIGGALFLALLVVGTEVAERIVVRTTYWGAEPAVPFYAVSFRSGIGGILALAAVADYLGGTTSPTLTGTSAALLTAVALVALEVAGGLLSVPDRRPEAGRVGGPLAGGLFGVVAFFLLGLGPAAGPFGTLLAPLVVIAGSFLVYRGRRGILSSVPPPSAVGRPPADRPLPYGRTPAPPAADEGTASHRT